MFKLPEEWRRKKGSRVVSGGNEVFDSSYNRATSALKTLTLNGMLSPLGDCATLKTLPDIGALVALYNPSSTTTVYAAFGDQAVAANPTSGVDGIAIPPLSYMYLSSGIMTNVKATGQCFAYIIEDDTFLAIQNG